MLETIEQVELDDTGLVGLARERRHQARAIVEKCADFFPLPLRWTFPIGDRMARYWLRHNETPFRQEIGEISEALGFSGAHLLNSAYEWGCTAAIVDDPTPAIIRTLDWPFHGLGRYTLAVRQTGPAGPFVHVTWPGASGVLTGVAKGRFTAALNMAPLRRRTRGNRLRFTDYTANAVETFLTCRAVPASHLLRQVFEHAEDFDQAIKMLAETPVAKPVIYIVAGLEIGQGAIVERTPMAADIRRQTLVASNDWLAPRHGWEGRSQSELSGAEDCRLRKEALAGATRSSMSFDWFEPPVRNPMTRLAIEADAVHGSLRVRSYEPNGVDDVEAVGEGIFSV